MKLKPLLTLLLFIVGFVVNSPQDIYVTGGAIDYKSKNAIVLNPGFSTSNNAVFNAKIVSSCVE